MDINYFGSGIWKSTLNVAEHFIVLFLYLGTECLPFLLFHYLKTEDEDRETQQDSEGEGAPSGDQNVDLAEENNPLTGIYGS